MEYLRTEFPQKLTWSEDELHKSATEWYDEVREDGAARSTYNPDSKWDWWTIGGRWEKQYRDRQGQKVSDFRAELEKALIDVTDPEAIAELALVEAEVDRVRENMRAGRTTWEDLDAARAKKLDCKAYLPWWFPYNLVLERGDEFAWLEKGKMGWFGSHSDKVTDEEWIKGLLHETSDLDQNSRLYFIDFHV